MTIGEFLSQAKEPIHILGWVAQGVFFSRFVVQWIASEKHKESVIPIGFWWCSIAGGMLMLVYAFLIESPPIIIAQMFGLVVYFRNLTFVYRKRRRDARRTAAPQQSKQPESEQPESEQPES